MRTYIILFSICFVSFGLNTKRARKLVFLFYQQKNERPIGNSLETFWEHKNDFDTITIYSTNLINKIERKIIKFTPIDHEISYQAAVIRYNTDNRIDTIYSDRFFHDWEIDGRYLEDKSEFLEKMFVNFFNGQIEGSH